MRRGRGISLGGVMLASLLMSVIALGLTRLSVAHLWLSSRSNTSLQASSLANSAAAAAVARLLERPTYGASDPDIVLERDGGRAVVTFSPDRAEALEVPYSTSNFEGTSPVEGFAGRQVAPATALVIASCNVGGSRRTVEVVLKIPPFPWAIVAGGTLQTRERVFIGAIPEGVWPPPPDDELLPADILANGTGERSIVLAGECFVLGDVESPGGIELEGEQVQVKGEVRSGVEPIEVPLLRAEQYDPETLELDFDNLQDVDLTSPEVLIQGAARKQGPLEVNGLRLEGGQLFVDGDLTVSGSVTGNGTLVSTGDIRIQGLTLDASTDLALLADGRVELTGENRSASAVRGLFYAGEGLSAKDLTVVGTVVAGRSQGEVELENARVLAQPSVTQPSSGQVRGGNYTVIGSGRGRQASTYRCFPAEQVTSGVPAFHFQVIPTNGGYPVRLVFTPGTEPNVASMNTTLYAPDDWAQLETSLAGAVSIPEQFLRLILQGMVDAVGSGGTTTTEPETAVNLLGDLSRFLPFEERVRVVSWIER